MLNLSHSTFKSVAQASSLNCRLTSCILLDISIGWLIRHVELFNMSKTIPGFPPQTFVFQSPLWSKSLSFLPCVFLGFPTPGLAFFNVLSTLQHSLTLLFLFFKGKIQNSTMILHDCPRVAPLAYSIPVTLTFLIFFEHFPLTFSPQGLSIFCSFSRYHAWFYSCVVCFLSAQSSVTSPSLRDSFFDCFTYSWQSYPPTYHLAFPALFYP